MEFTDTSSYIKVEINNKTVKVQGEMIVEGFLAYSDSIKTLEPPYDDVVIDELTKKELIQAAIDKTKNSDFNRPKPRVSSSPKGGQVAAQGFYFP